MTKTIFITGSSSGIGKATAKYFQAKGWNVIATMRSPDKEQELTSLANVMVTRLDVLDKASIADAINAAIDRFGKIDVFVNNAGYGAFGLLEAASSEKIERQFNTNVIGLLECTKAILPHFRSNKEGVLINISSIAGKVCFPISALYNGTKFAVEGITEALSYELKAIGVKAKLIEPGAIATDFTGRSFDLINDESLSEYQPLLQNMMAGMSGFADNALSAEKVAETIYQAATDGTDRLRYLVGDDAIELNASRKKQSDEEHMQAIAAMLPLS